MKKLVIIVLLAMSFGAASAQSWNSANQRKERRQVTERDARNNNDQYHSNDYAYNDHNLWKNDRDHQADYGRMNKQNDKRSDRYSSGHRAHNYNRDKQIWQGGQQRQQPSKSFGTGAIVGGVAGFLLGVLVSH
jgi:hypothetical protein